MIKFGARLWTDISGAYGNALDAAFMAGDRGINGILVKDGWIVICIGNARTSESLRGPRYIVWARFLRKDLKLARFADVPILAKLAAQIAAARPKGQHRRPRKEVIERLLLDGVDAEPTRTPVRRQDNRITLASSHEAKCALAFMQSAEARAQIALDAAIV
jgi:hypothetical protein